MSSIAEELADKLAKDVIEAAEALDDERLVEQIAQTIGASSPTTEELFRTAVRVRTAEARGRRALEARLAKARAEAEHTAKAAQHPPG